MRSKETKHLNICSPSVHRNLYDAALAGTDNEFGRKLRTARREKKLSQTDLAKALERHNLHIVPTAVSKWELGESLPNLYTLFALCFILDIKEPLSFFTGIESEASGLHPNLNAAGMAKVQEYISDLAASGRYTAETSPVSSPVPQPCIEVSHISAEPPAAAMRTARIYELPVSAGTGALLDQSSYEECEFPASSIPDGTDFGVRVSGDSMMPAYTDQQIVWVKQCSSLHSGEIGIFLYDGNAYIKQFSQTAPAADEAARYSDDAGHTWDKIRLVSLNKAYAPIEILPDSDFHIFGKVLN
ncbi:MAG: XRE family transcriptional regulator [Lachnospiraceae bacterium]|nr:XRE family transcriptional regulator [Lachnospiraceae bacterium]